NKYFFFFLNTCVSNFGDKNDIALFIDAAKENYKAHEFYLQGNYNQAFKEIRLAHKILSKLYRQILVQKYRRDARILLDKGAPIIVGAKDPRAEHFLKLGYRDLVDAYRLQRQADNSNRFLFSLKIRLYIDAIKLVRQAKRYAFLGLIESKTPLPDKKDFQTQTLNEYLNKTKPPHIPDFDRVKNTITNMLNRRLFPNYYDFFRHIHDNYGLKYDRDILKENQIEISK
ncbi:MAG: hypothetical protein D6767_11065, partial [Candidatus Hydrogenedentota bacterium]